MLKYKKILCPTDFSGPSYAGLQQAVEFAGHFGAELCLVHVVPVLPSISTDPNLSFRVPEYEQALHVDAERNLKALMEKRVPKGVKARAIIGHGDAGSEIVRIADEEKAELIVISTHGLTGWRHMMYGSVAEKVVRLAQCPVMSVRAPHE